MPKQLWKLVEGKVDDPQAFRYSVVLSDYQQNTLSQDATLKKQKTEKVENIDLSKCEPKDIL